MRPRTPKRAAQDRQANQWRQQRCYEIGACELCGTRDLTILSLHEVVRGGVRRFVYTNPALTICLCNGERDCHTFVSRWSAAKQIALLRIRRPNDFSFTEFNRWSTRKLDLADVEAAADELLSELTHDSY